MRTTRSAPPAGGVTEWQGSEVRALLLGRADLVVCLDLPRWRVFTQLVRRTLHRRMRRVVLWNGNVEPPLWIVFTDPEHVVRWTWSSYRRNRRRVRDLAAAAAGPPVVLLRSRREVRCWLADPVIPGGAGAPPGRAPAAGCARRWGRR